ncbi:putative defense protein [Daphnia carinata]|uniref:putative defense protein n=1 Tax=Daphnia carinata TaxID=120202 RepID=UPI00257AA641|nr:putative defense protein [Daphnia carinata]
MLCNKNMYTCAVVLAFLLASASIDRIDGAPDGAPLEACETMTPGHGVDPQLITSSPFQTEIPSGQYAIMDNALNLELRSKNDVTTYKGFLVMAFDMNDATKPIGTFELPSDGKVIDCSGIVGSAATHKVNNEKKLTTVQWVPPQGFMGTAIFRTTYVHNVTTFWVKTESIAVTYVMELPTSSTSEAPVVTTPSSASQTGTTWISLITFSLMTSLMR